MEPLCDGQVAWTTRSEVCVLLGERLAFSLDRERQTAEWSRFGLDPGLVSCRLRRLVFSRAA